MIVVDTNILAYLYLSSDRSEQADKALQKDPYGRRRYSGGVNSEIS